MLRYMLDTNIISDMVRDSRGPVAQTLIRVGSRHTCVSVIVAAEMHFGFEKSGSTRLKARIDEALETISILPFEPPADEIYGRIRADLQARGQPIGGNDLFIAAHALALDLTLVTGNEREFRRVDGLRVENWLSA